jgi:hypothetical protein
MALGDFGVIVSPNTVARLLHQMGYSLRVNHKQLSTDFSPDRNDQFLYLNDLRRRFQRRGLPIISVDTKKRELVGNFKNPGSRWDLSPRLVNDHDFRSDSTGVAIPYGIYDLLANRGSVVVGVSHDTSAFAAHAIAHWWRQEGWGRYPRSPATAHSERYWRQQWLSLPRLENRAPVSTGRFARSDSHGCPLPDWRFQVEPN